MGIPKTKLLELLPAGYDNSIIELLDVAGYMTFREYDGLDDFFVYHTKMMSPDGSDFRYMEDVRVKNKIIRETRKEALLLKNDDIDLEDIQGEPETRAKFISAPLTAWSTTRRSAPMRRPLSRDRRRPSSKMKPCVSKSAICPVAISARSRSTWDARLWRKVNGRRKRPCSK